LTSLANTISPPDTGGKRGGGSKGKKTPAGAGGTGAGAGGIIRTSKITTMTTLGLTHAQVGRGPSLV